MRQGQRKMSDREQAFDYVIVYRPDRPDTGAGMRSTLEKASILSSGLVLAKDENAARVAAALMIPETHRDRLDRLEVAVRPFC